MTRTEFTPGMQFYVVEKCAYVKLICEDMIGPHGRNTYWLCEVTRPGPHFMAGDEIHVGVRVLERSHYLKEVWHGGNS